MSNQISHSTAQLKPSKNLKDFDVQLRDSIFQGAASSKEFADSPVVSDIMDHLDSLKLEVRKARESCDVQTIVWIRDAVFAWQSLMTNVLKIPCNVREKVGIQAEDNYFDKIDAMDLLNRQAHQIAAKRKLNRKLEEATYFLRYPERINAEIASTKEECDQDWFQSCLFLALDLLQGRLHSSILADPNIARVLDNTFVEDVIQLKAYLLWEASRTGFSQDEAEQFYCSATEQLTAFLRSQVHDTFLMQLSLQRECEWSTNPSRKSDQKSQKISLKTRWLEQRHGWSFDTARSLATQQVSIFDDNIVSALKGDNEAIKLVKSCVMFQDSSQLTFCTTALECLIVEKCLERAQPLQAIG